MAGRKKNRLKDFWFIFPIFEPKLFQFKVFPQNVCSANLALLVQSNTPGPQKIFGRGRLHAALGPQIGHLWIIVKNMMSLVDNTKVVLQLFPQTSLMSSKLGQKGLTLKNR